MSNPSNAPSKLGNAASPTVSPAPSQIGNSSTDSASRRSGGSGSFGAGQIARTAGGQPRSNKQASKNQHTKQSRRYRFADEDAMAESAAMRSFTNKKGQTSITHLMNFALPPRPSNQYRPDNHRHVRRNPTWGLGSGYHAVDKARYVHANYRFIVDPRQDYHVQSVDADVYLEWTSILQVLASPLSQSAACPICLGDPVAPRMAKCGHIFCLPCLIRYMHSSDDSGFYQEKKSRWKKCPICWDAVYLSDVRPVRWYQGQEQTPPREGGDIVLRLVARPAGSTLALPKEGSSSNPANIEDVPWHYAADVMDFSRVMRGTTDYMLGQYDGELEQLDQVERHDELMFGEDAEWTIKAAKSVREARERAKEYNNVPITETPKRGRPQPAASSDASDPVSSVLSRSISTFRAQQHPNHFPQQPPSDYYFYQALLHYYLSPLDIRILRSAFGPFSNFPSTILPRVERLSTGHVVDDDLLRRMKYLAHLPHGCEVAFLECDWTDTVPATVLEAYKREIETRRKRNHDKDAREERERIRAEKKEDEQRWAAVRRKRPSSNDHVPETSSLEAQGFQPLNGIALDDDQEAALTGTSPIWTSFTRSRPGANGSSFASLASPSTSPSQTRTVWGTTAVAPLSPPVSRPLNELQESGNADDGWLQGWETDLLDDNVDAEVVARTQALSLGDTTGNGEGSSKTTNEQISGMGGTSSAKKKKGKKITLMSTNARRGA